MEAALPSHARYSDEGGICWWLAAELEPEMKVAAGGQECPPYITSSILSVPPRTESRSFFES